MTSAKLWTPCRDAAGQFRQSYLPSAASALAALAISGPSIDQFRQPQSKTTTMHILAAHPHAFNHVGDDHKESK